MDIVRQTVRALVQKAERCDMDDDDIEAARSVLKKKDELKSQNDKLKKQLARAVSLLSEYDRCGSDHCCTDACGIYRCNGVCPECGEPSPQDHRKNCSWKLCIDESKTLLES